jgi:hypothetical protein
MLFQNRSAPLILVPSEEQQLVDYIIAMQDLGFPLTILHLKLKVAIITQGKDAPFTNSILRIRLLRWLKKTHFKLSLRLAQGLDAKWVKNLCTKNVKIFYDNLTSLYDTYQYSPSCIWDHNESRNLVGRNGGYILVKTRSQNAHQVVPNEWEWLMVLTCINVTDESIPNFYIFYGKIFKRNNIQ